HPGSKLLSASGPINPDLPTIVLTHGLSAKSDSPFEEPFDDTKIWIGSKATGATTLIQKVTRKVTGENTVNIIRFYWEDAFKVTNFPQPGPQAKEYIEARKYVFDAGQELAVGLMEALGEDYAQPIHFIGHSLGTAVNAYAARAFLEKAKSVRPVQFTALDRPDNIRKIPLTTLPLFPPPDWFEKVWGFPENFFGCVLPTDNPEIDIRIDNYFARNFDGDALVSWAGVGDKASGSIYNHSNLLNPNNLDDLLFSKEGASNDHSGVQQWYRWAIDPDNPIFIDRYNANLPFTDEYVVSQGIFGPIITPVKIKEIESFCSGVDLIDPIKSHEKRINASLNPCQKGWHWAMNGPEPGAFPEASGKEILSCKGDGSKYFENVLLNEFLSVGICSKTIISTPTFDGEIVEYDEINCREGSSSFAVSQIDIRENAEYLFFDYRFNNIGDGDYVTLYLDDKPIWLMSGKSVIQGETNEAGPIPISGFTGTRTLTIALNGVGEVNADISIEKLRLLVNGNEVVVNSSPIADAGGPYQTIEGSTIELNGAGSYDANDDLLVFAWDLNGDGVHGEDSGAVANYFAKDDGDFLIGLKVADRESEDAIVSQVFVENADPVVVSVDNRNTKASEQLDITVATFKDPGIGDTHTAMIDWGDGTMVSGGIKEIDGEGSVFGKHVYSVSGGYVVKIIVTDDDGGVGEDEFNITVASTTTESIIGDLDGDGDVDGEDRNILRAALRSCEGDTGYTLEADYDGDGCITFADYRIWYGYYQAYVNSAE
ncbi:MAG: hypothetical protein GQ532_07535, partial [Methylomarinum sp.]|nr:hypothetical protein [Methylomarinum sp.]